MYGPCTWSEEDGLQSWPWWSKEEPEEEPQKKPATKDNKWQGWQPSSWQQGGWQQGGWQQEQGGWRDQWHDSWRKASREWAESLHHFYRCRSLFVVPSGGLGSGQAAAPVEWGQRRVPLARRAEESQATRFCVFAGVTRNVVSQHVKTLYYVVLYASACHTQSSLIMRDLLLHPVFPYHIISCSLTSCGVRVHVIPYSHHNMSHHGRPYRVAARHHFMTYNSISCQITSHPVTVDNSPNPIRTIMISHFLYDAACRDFMSHCIMLGLETKHISGTDHRAPARREAAPRSLTTCPTKLATWMSAAAFTSSWVTIQHRVLRGRIGGYSKYMWRRWVCCFFGRCPRMSEAGRRAAQVASPCRAQGAVQETGP